MTRFITKWFRREKTHEHIPRPSEPGAIGIPDSTCEINGDPFNQSKLPIPAEEQRQLRIDSPRNPQHQSRFFQFPPEIRRLIYIELLGGCRVHIDYAFKWLPLFGPQKKSRDRRRSWQWWHIVCEGGHSFIENHDSDYCNDFGDEAHEARKFKWNTAPLGTKIVAVHWLTCCQMAYEEALPILYGSNIFVTRHKLDTPFHMSRILLPDYTSLITSMDISIHIGGPHTNPPEITGEWAKFYPAFFELFHHTFRDVCRLRLTMRLKPVQVCPDAMTDKNLDTFLAPWEALATSRDWTKLDLCVPEDWYGCLTGRATGHKRWTLSKTQWTGSSYFPRRECV